MTKEELYKLRYNVYAQRGYIKDSKYPQKMEIDEYDKNNNCHRHE